MCGGFSIVVTHTVKGGGNGWLMFCASVGFGIDLRSLSCSTAISLVVLAYVDVRTGLGLSRWCRRKVMTFGKRNV
jgi:hypothetical protein